MKRPKAQANNSELLATVKQLCTILKSEGNVWDTHILLQDNWAIAHNQVIGIGEKIKEDFFACPNAILLKEALSKCGQNISITQLEQKLSIKSDKFRALVPCVPSENLTRIKPDPSVASLDDRLKASLEAASILPYDENNLLTASVLIHNGSVISSDRKIILESFHGIDMPTLVLPKIIMKAIKDAKPLKSFGFSDTSLTIYLENDNWIKSQLYSQQWPDVYSILNGPCNLMPIPDDLWTALASIEQFSDDGWAYTRNNKIYSHSDDNLGASYDCHGIPPNIVFSISQFQSIKSWAKKIDFFGKTPSGLNCIKAYGENIRCTIAGRV